MSEYLYRRTRHAAEDTKYYLVSAPRYQKWILREDIRYRMDDLFRQCTPDCGCEIAELEVAKEHVHVLRQFPSRYSSATVVGNLKNISETQIFNEVPKLSNHLMKEEFWKDGYSHCPVGDAITISVINRYTQYHRHKKHDGTQTFYRLPNDRTLQSSDIWMRLLLGSHRKLIPAITLNPYRKPVNISENDMAFSIDTPTGTKKNTKADSCTPSPYRDIGNILRKSVIGITTNKYMADIRVFTNSLTKTAQPTIETWAKVE